MEGMGKRFVGAQPATYWGVAWMVAGGGTDDCEADHHSDEGPKLKWE
jgi:hypothetical protein